MHESFSTFPYLITIFTGVNKDSACFSDSLLFKRQNVLIVFIVTNKVVMKITSFSLLILSCFGSLEINLFTGKLANNK